MINIWKLQARPSKINLDLLRRQESGSQVRRPATQLPALMGTLLHCPDMSAGQDCIVMVKPVPSDLLSYALSQAGKMSERMGSSHKLLCNPQGR